MSDPPVRHPGDKFGREYDEKDAAAAGNAPLPPWKKHGEGETHNPDSLTCPWNNGGHDENGPRCDCPPPAALTLEEAIKKARDEGRAEGREKERRDVCAYLRRRSQDQRWNSYTASIMAVWGNTADEIGRGAHE